MSYILDALKKLEHEKSRKSRVGGMINISGALFENERPKPSRAAGWKIALAVTIAILVTFAVTWQFLQSGKGREKPSARLAAPPPPTSPVKVEIAPAPPVPAAVPVQQALPAASSVPAPAAPVRVPDNNNPAKPQEAVEQSVPATDDDEDRASRKRARGRKGQVLPAEQAGAAPADIQLSGIAWQEERRARRAVVNGFLMREGGVVSGARITDIYQDRVRFSLSGKIFEIPLISTPVSAAGK
jgi:general secretion pathway protein B